MADVSIIMAAYNARDFINEAIESVLQQTYTNWELIVVDDCSSDGTADYVEQRYRSEPRISIFRLAKNSGPGGARNAGLLLAKGNWITVLDSDDKYKPNRIATLIERCERDGLDLVADNQLFLDDSSKQIVQKGFSLFKDQVPLTLALLVKNDGAPVRFPLGMLKPFVRRTVLLQNKITYPEEMRVGEDFVFLFKILKCGAKAALLSEPYYIYTLPHARLTKSVSEKTRTNYGIGNIECLLQANQALIESLSSADPQYAEVIELLNIRRKRFLCAMALRDAGDMIRRGHVISAIRHVLHEDWQMIFLFDKARNLFQKCHTVRGVV